MQSLCKAYGHSYTCKSCFYHCLCTSMWASKMATTSPTAALHPEIRACVRPSRCLWITFLINPCLCWWTWSINSPSFSFRSSTMMENRLCSVKITTSLQSPGSGCYCWITVDTCMILIYLEWKNIGVLDLKKKKKANSTCNLESILNMFIYIFDPLIWSNSLIRQYTVLRCLMTENLSYLKHQKLNWFSRN